MGSKVYESLEEERGGMSGALLGRGAAQVLLLRPAVLPTGCAGSGAGAGLRDPDPPTSVAALAVWEYIKQSTLYLFGDALGDPVADRFLRAIQTGPQTDTDLAHLTGVSSVQKEVALNLLLRYRRAHEVTLKTAGRPVREWHAGALADCPTCCQREDS